MFARRKGVSAKDVILKVLEKFGTKGNVGWIFEYFGPGAATLDVPSRATITNIVAVLGVTTSSPSTSRSSSREHAALCPMYLGVKAVIAKSVERIHRANLINFGIVPFTFADPKDYDKIAADDTLEFPAVKAAVEGDGEATVKVNGKAEIKVRTSLSDRERHLILCGGLLASL